MDHGPTPLQISPRGLAENAVGFVGLDLGLRGGGALLREREKGVARILSGWREMDAAIQAPPPSPLRS